MSATSRGGFSLLEVLLATSILLGCVIVLGHLVALGSRRARALQDLSTAQILCATKMSELLAGAAPLETVDEVPLVDQSGWTVSVALQPTEHAELTALRVTVAQDVPAPQRGRSFALVRWLPAPNRVATGTATAGPSSAPRLPVPPQVPDRAMTSRPYPLHFDPAAATAGIPPSCSARRLPLAAKPPVAANLSTPVNHPPSPIWTGGTGGLSTRVQCTAGQASSGTRQNELCRPPRGKATPVQEPVPKSNAAKSPAPIPCRTGLRLPGRGLDTIDCRPAKDRGGPSGRAGFTLLELLLATALAAVMLVALWSLLSMQTRLFATAPAQIERCRLVRALYQQIADDLHHALCVPGNDPAPSAGSLSAEPSAGTAAGVTGLNLPTAVAPNSGGRPSALVGTEQTLQLNILEVTPPPTAPVGIDEDDQEAVSRAGVSELRSISYELRSADRPHLSEDTDRRGLMRREIAWGAADADTGAAHVPWAFLPAATSPATAGSQLTADQGLVPDQGSLSGSPEPSGPERSTTWVPEVVGIELRYFDGSTWSTWWDSMDRRALPAAIEVVLHFDTDSPRRRRSVERSAAGRAPPVPDAAEAQPRADAVPPQPAPDGLAEGSYRFVVFLPAAPRSAEQAVAPAARAAFRQPGIVP